MTDLLVAGGGPAGLATALYAHHAGLDVTVWEPRPDVIDKACGEGLMPGALAALHDLGVDPAGHPLTGIRYVAGEHRAEASFRGGPGRGVRRTTLHAALRDAVLDAGVEIARRGVSDVRQDADGMVVDGVRTRYLVAADGLHSPIRRSLGLDGRPSPVRRYGLRCHAERAPWTSHVEVHWAAAAEAYVTPVAADRVGIAVLTSGRGSFEEQLAGFPELRDRVAGHELGEVRGAGPLRQRVLRRVAGRVLLVGDASGYVDALTGEGIALGIAQARAAAAAVALDDPERYERQWHTITRRYRLLTTALLGASRWGPARRALVPAATLVPGVFAATVNTLARPA
ncbi:NAD(P)/FAD-dependent oxidoreductase [Nocardioides mesophilus]|uniref:NAD(P)/FAD-dependent oxidoreductase n=1 Tax=Nocardioides mesophilus TaxID=433659 RepID=A0A7G9RCZ5_9ACTN|nr:NAD(P)/FAD-dependent oxidoreductase [Nocardioides mesophilus]QNN53470.1 NAD(P)/FAD-dependent oxidoreductase [Nocardioides mesophilus]